MYSRWYHGSISREEAEKFLQPFRDGKYLVHDCPHKSEAAYVLCIRFV